ncbi:uncharacterized protein TNCV_2140041 [Trichonephila clavipes]|uniref:Uncharacterized protein n=1 Tax=Trichonephila clavipes TaxID=2585209 RepID=A0A8X6VAP9_TRICX|nr:uncharacterized protein TNCV_2140041 [Trichonephila clavipes]
MTDALYILAEAWDSLERQSLKNAWNKLWPDLEAEKYFNDNHREEIPGFQECNEDVETWMACNAEDCGFQMLHDDENNNSESSKGPSNADVFSELETAMEWYEQQSECCPTQLLQFKRIRDLVAKKQKCTMVQRILINFHNKVPGFIYCMDCIRLSEQLRIRTVFGPN